MNQPTVDSTDDDVIDPSHDVNTNANVNIVTAMKKVTRKMPTKATTALNAPRTKEKTRMDFGPTVCFTIATEKVCQNAQKIPDKVLA
jgi:hypothetical protein